MGCLGRLAEAVEAAGGTLVITADHGNAEMMRDPEDRRAAYRAHAEPGAVHRRQPAGRGGPRRARAAGRCRADLARHSRPRKALRDDRAFAARIGSEACGRVRLSGGRFAAVRDVAGTALPVAVAAALSASPAPALCDAPGAKTLGNSVLPPPPTPDAGPAPPALYGATSGAEPVRSPAAETPETRAGPSEAATEPASAAEQLAAARREAIDAARQTQECERALAAIRHEIDLLGSDADASRRGLAESRDEQARLLGAILHRARAAPPATADAEAPPIERLRAEALMREADPALRAQLRALTGEIARLDGLQKRIGARKGEEAAAQQALAAAREHLAEAVAHRNTLLREMAPPQGIDAALRIADTEREAKNLGDLIKRAEAAAESSGKQLERSRTGGSRKKPAPLSPADDPTRPSDLRSLSRESGLDEAEPATPQGSDRRPNRRRAAASAARSAGGRNGDAYRRRARHAGGAERRPEHQGGCRRHGGRAVRRQDRLCRAVPRSRARLDHTA